MCHNCKSFHVERKKFKLTKKVTKKKQATSEECHMCLTIVDNNFEKQLDADSKPSSFKPIFAHLIKAMQSPPVTGSLCRLQEFPRARSSLITPSDVYPD